MFLPDPSIRTGKKPPLPVDCQAASELVKDANRKGEYLLALEIAEDFLAASAEPPSVFFLQQKALALARSGSTQQALAILTQIRDESAGYAEILGLLGRVHKDLAGDSSEAADRRRFLAEAQRLYQSGFERLDAHGKRNTYCGINAVRFGVHDQPGFVAHGESGSRAEHGPIFQRFESSPSRDGWLLARLDGTAITGPAAARPSWTVSADAGASIRVAGCRS